MSDEEGEREFAYFVILFLIAAIIFTGWNRIVDQRQRQACLDAGGYIEPMLNEHGVATSDWTCRREDRE